MPVWLANDAPSTTSRSASFMSQLATGVPLRPRTPAASGWSSGTAPLALKVVTIGAPRRSASATIGSMSSRAPWPTMKTGRVARARRSSAAASDSAGGPISERPTRPSGSATGASGAGSVCTSSGKTRWATSRRSRACLQASAISSAWWLSGSTVWLHAATGANAAGRSTSWKAPGPRTWMSTWPVRASTGARSTLASHSPVMRLVAPGPAIVRHAAGRPVSLP